MGLLISRNIAPNINTKIFLYSMNHWGFMLSENFFHLWQDHFTLGRIDMPDLESRSSRRSHVRLVNLLNRSFVTLFCLPAIQSLIKNIGGNSTEWFASALKRYTRPIDTEVYEASKPSNSLIRSSMYYSNIIFYYKFTILPLII